MVSVSSIILAVDSFWRVSRRERSWSERLRSYAIKSSNRWISFAVSSRYISRMRRSPFAASCAAPSLFDNCIPAFVCAATAAAVSGSTVSRQPVCKVSAICCQSLPCPLNELIEQTTPKSCSSNTAGRPGRPRALGEKNTVNSLRSTQSRSVCVLTPNINPTFLGGKSACMVSPALFALLCKAYYNKDKFTPKLFTWLVSWRKVPKLNSGTSARIREVANVGIKTTEEEAHEI